MDVIRQVGLAMMTAANALTDRQQYGIALAQGFGDVTALRRNCRLVEELGFGSAWVTDHLRGPDAFLEPFSALAYCAALTERVRLGIAVAVSFARSPVHMAQAVASLDQVSGGRLEMGIGCGAPRLARAFGVTTDDAFSRFQASLAAMKRLWTQPEVTDHQRYWDLEGWKAGLRPAQVPHPPLWIGARIRKALRLAVDEGTGWVGAGSSSYSDFVRQVGVIRDYLQETGRDPASFRVAKRVYLSVSDGSAGGIDEVRAWFDHHYGDPAGADRFAVTGDVAACAEQVVRLRQAGAELIILHPVFGTPSQLEAAAAVADLASSAVTASIPSIPPDISRQ